MNQPRGAGFWLIAFGLCMAQCSDKARPSSPPAAGSAGQGATSNGQAGAGADAGSADQGDAGSAGGFAGASAAGKSGAGGKSGASSAGGDGSLASAGNGAGEPVAGAGGHSTGAAGSSGSTSTVAFQCDTLDGPAPGTPGSCLPAEISDGCQQCVQAHCCTEFAECFATNPGNQCGWGGPNDEGEIVCMQKCVQDGFADTGVVDYALLLKCADSCSTNAKNKGSKECGPLIGMQTNDLVVCLNVHCPVECFGG